MDDPGNAQQNASEQAKTVRKDEPMPSTSGSNENPSNEGKSGEIKVKEEPIDQSDVIDPTWIFNDQDSNYFDGSMKEVEVFDQAHEFTFKCQVPDYFGVDLEDRVSRNETTPNEMFHTVEMLKLHIVIAAKLLLPSGKRVVAKRFDLVQFGEDDYKKLIREIELSRLLKHHHIARYYQCFWEENADRRPIYFYIIRERLDFSLDKYYAHISRYDGTAEERKRDHRLLSALLVQILKALQFLQERDIIHRDISPKSIGVNQNGFLIKLIDFGCSRKEDPNLEHTLQPGADYLYQAPEMLAGKPYNTKVDVWSAAVVAVEMLGCKLLLPAGWTPYTIKADILKRILKLCGWTATDKYEEIYGDVFTDELGLSMGMVPQIEKEIPVQRLEADRGPLTKENFLDLVKRMLCVDPRKRPNAEECLKEERYLMVMNKKYDEVHDVPSQRDCFLDLIKRLRDEPPTNFVDDE